MSRGSVKNIKMLPDKYETRGTRRPDKKYKNPSLLLKPIRIPHVMAKVV